MAVAIEERADEKKAEPVRTDFSETEQAVLHAEDVYTATAVAGIMITIFLIAAILYTVIAVMAAGAPS